MTRPRVFVSTDSLRAQFAAALSEMYRLEVPQYGTLLGLVEDVNRENLARNPELAHALRQAGELERLNVERHGAIRVGTPAELSMLRRLFAVLGMYPVGYYDLSSAGVPVHSTAFRPVEDEALRRNPFRVFTSLLRLELIEDPELRARAGDILARRDIFTAGGRELIQLAEDQGGLDQAQAGEFVQEALETFRWHQRGTVDLPTYQALQRAHRLIADVVCFRGPHINHLTPRTLDIDAVQRRMPEQGISPKAIIEGPPPRRCPILLRQTSFKALEEPIEFIDQRPGQHTARFGEVEQRGIALTRKGRQLYDRLLDQSRRGPTAVDNGTHQAQLSEVFQAFPDDYSLLRRQGLAFFSYSADPRALPALESGAAPDLEALIEAGALAFSPMVYEDFLPVSAAGIFQSNLDGSRSEYQGAASQPAFEAALGCRVIDEIGLYEQRQAQSLARALAELGVVADLRAIPH